MRKLAICVPTYNRADIINEFIIRCMNKYTNMKYDVYIYDSSDNNETEKVVKSYLDKYENLFYVNIDSSVHSNMKVYMIFQQFQNCDYEYIWVCSDSIRWTDDVINSIDNNLNSNYDMIILNYRDVESIGTKEYTDYNELFVDCAWHMTLYGATIIKKHTILNNIDWDYLIEKYCIDDRINHSHVALYFEQLCKINRFSALHISTGKNSLTSSPLKSVSGWHESTFYVWGHCWPSMIEALPGCYKNKKVVIKKAGVNSGIFDLDNLISLRKYRILTYNVYKKYKNKWKEITDVNAKLIFLVSIVPPNVGVFLSKQFRNQIRLKNKMKKFCKKYPLIYIYGCGNKANGFAAFLDELNIEYQGFLVTSLENEKSELRCHSVIEYNKALFENPNVGIIMGLNLRNYSEVMQNVVDEKYKYRIFSDFHH